MTSITASITASKRDKAVGATRTRRAAHDNPSLFEAVMGAENARSAALMFLLGAADAATAPRTARRQA